MDYRTEIINSLINAKIDSPRLEANIILQFAAPDYPQMTLEEEKKINECVQRRCMHEPLDKIIGKKDFYKSTFKVSTEVLTPRPDTEVLVETALELIKPTEKINILDLGTGSGCILLSILKERTQCKGVGVDISSKAINIAKENAQKMKLEKSVELVNADWNYLNLNNLTFEMIVSNPPYIPREEIQTLDTEVKKYDPIIALDGGDDGLKCYRDIAEIIPLFLKKGGYVLLEVGYNQAKQVEAIYSAQGLSKVKTIQDLAGINRCVVFQNTI